MAKWIDVCGGSQVLERWRKGKMMAQWSLVGQKMCSPLPPLLTLVVLGIVWNEEGGIMGKLMK
jgi:hypothetical protein